MYKSKKYGFTLVELLGVIIIIGLLALLIIPSVERVLEESRQKLYDNQIENIELAANSWALDNLFVLPENDGDYIIVELKQLKDEGYIDKNIINPLTDEAFANDMQIKITRKGSRFIYEALEETIEHPVITLNGDETTIVGLGGTYTEMGAKALTTNGIDISNQIKITGTVDTTKIGTYYLKYNVSYNGFKATEVTRMVVVMDNNPVITLNPSKTKGYEKKVTVHVSVTPYPGNTVSSFTYKLDSGTEQTVTNNQIILNTEGTHTIEVTATDNQGNTTTTIGGPYNIDTIPPTITFDEGDTEGITIDGTVLETYDLKTGMDVTDNYPITKDDVTITGNLASIPGEYELTYKAIDQAGYVTTKTRKVTVYCPTITLMGKEVNTCSTRTNDPDGNLRYVGPNPSNYIEFNGELWRIIGAFNGQTKIIRNDYYSTSTTWDASTNDWNTSDLQATLNGTYLSSIQTNNPTSYGYIDLEHIWNIGGTPNHSGSTRSDFYTAERSETKSSAMDSHLWEGAIGLMYPSDYGYASSGSTETCDSAVLSDWDTEPAKAECAKNSWLYDSSQSQWTLTPRSDTSHMVFSVNFTGYVGNGSVSGLSAVRPVLYLKSNVIIESGTGTSEDPFKLKSPKTFTEVMTNNPDVATLDPDNNLRYVGKTPNNYVKFNGDELWRIIGVFNGQAKIIRNDYYSTEIAWDEDDGSYSNNWATASLNLLWNDEENENSYINTIEKNDPTSYGYIDLEHVWNIGGTPNYNSSTRSDFYTAERSGTPAGATGSEATWTGAIGLMYPSDYGYASSGLSETCNNTVMYKWRTSKDETAYTECAQKSWLYDSSKNQWTLTPRSDGSNYAFFVYDAGHVYSIYVYYSFAARPVLYLKSDTKIVGGLGTDQQPFILGT